MRCIRHLPAISATLGLVRHHADYGKWIRVLSGPGEDKQLLRGFSFLLEYRACLSVSGSTESLGQYHHCGISRNDGIRSHSLRLSDQNGLTQTLYPDIWNSMGCCNDSEFTLTTRALDNTGRLEFLVISALLPRALSRSPSARSGQQRISTLQSLRRLLALHLDRCVEPLEPPGACHSWSASLLHKLTSTDW